jgi:hypothetical protein
VRGHDSRGEHNNMFGKKGVENPNFGKIRTCEMKERYSKAFIKKFKDKPKPL